MCNSGKTLSFNLACDMLQGRVLNHSVPFQRLKKAKKSTYQCSVDSTGPKIKVKVDDVLRQQRDINERDDDAKQPNSHVCILGIDEAGLIPENRQALKSLHDYLDMRECSTVMMSNSTLDAAKTSRTVQLLQTPANMTDLEELAWGLLVDEKAERTLKLAQPGGPWRRKVQGLCQAFYTLGEVGVLRDQNWFHSRDFVFACRMLRRLIDGRNLPTLFDADILLTVLRRHFQTLAPHDFPILALHFLDRCGLDSTDTGAKVLQSLHASLQDALDDNADPTSAHCRYTMVVDPTDSEAAVDLLFALKLLDQDSTRVLSLSEFPEDLSPTHQTAVLAQIKRSILEGETVLLVNSAPLQSALYDVINRHYRTDTEDDGTKSCYAQIALDSFSRSVKVHPKFRLVVHVAQSQLSKTPLPFLNRLEKFTLSVSDALQHRIAEVALHPPLCLQTIADANRKKLFDALLTGVHHFVSFAGGSSSFYGMSPTETVPALVLQALEEACQSSAITFQPRSNVFLQQPHQSAPISAVEADISSAADAGNADDQDDGVVEVAEPSDAVDTVCNSFYDLQSLTF